MIDTVSELTDEYIVEFFDDGLILNPIDDQRVDVMFPFITHYGDHVVVYVTKGNEEDTFVISDGGETLANSLLSVLVGGSSNTSIKKICGTYGVTRTKADELKVDTTINDFPSKLFNFIQAILAIDAGSRFV